jgi:hypothetical protein
MDVEEEIEAVAAQSSSIAFESPGLARQLRPNRAAVASASSASAQVAKGQ